MVMVGDGVSGVAPVEWEEKERVDSQCDSAVLHPAIAPCACTPTHPPILPFLMKHLSPPSAIRILVVLMLSPPSRFPRPSTSNGDGK